MRKETIAIHSGYEPDKATKSVSVPIYQTAAYAFDSADHAAALFNLEADGFRYSRINNPTVAVLEKRVNDLEGGVGALATASGQAALHIALINLADQGGNIVTVPQLYGTTATLTEHVLSKQGIETRFAASDKPEDIAKLIDENTRAVFCESIGNPAGNVCDIEGLAKVAHAAGVPLVVDNTVATPILLRPFEYGADVVVHSLTKFLGGHGTTLGGCIVDGGAFDWLKHGKRFPAYVTADKSYHGMIYAERFGATAYIERARSVYQRTMGAVLSPFNAFLLMQGIETVALRIERHVANARKAAEFLRADPRVAWVNYAGFDDSQYKPLVEKYLGGNASSLFTFGVKGGLEAGKRFYDALNLVTRLVNIGDAKSLACHPASTTHRQMSPDQQKAAGVLPEAIRLSIGIEHIDDIIADLDQALAVAAGGQMRNVKSRTRVRVTEGVERPISIGLVNNMPDSALEATEQQFARLVKAAANGRDHHLHFYSMDSVPRSDESRSAMAGKYTSTARLGEIPLDALIVTGTEPKAAKLPDEPYWPEFTRLVDWAKDNTVTTIWSCLAAHAAVLHLDGIERKLQTHKVSGVFDCNVMQSHPLVAGLAKTLPVCHSRWNALERGDLVAAGYRILTQSPVVGVDSFTKDFGSKFVFFQGHPEYDATSLPKEYRRDVKRFLSGQRSDYPELPTGCFDENALFIHESFKKMAITLGEARSHMNAPELSPKPALHQQLRSTAVGFYQNWFEMIATATLSQQRKLAVNS